MDIYIKNIDVDIQEITKVSSEKLDYIEGQFTVDYIAVIGKHKIEGSRISNGDLDSVSIAGIKDGIERELKEKVEELKAGD